MNKFTPEVIEIELLNLMQQSRKLNNILEKYKSTPSFYEMEHVVSMVSNPIILRFNKLVNATQNDKRLQDTFMQVTSFVEGYDEIRKLAQYVSAEISEQVQLDSLSLAVSAAKIFPIFGDNEESAKYHLLYGLKELKNGTLNPLDTTNFDDYPYIGFDRETQAAICMGEKRDNVFQYQYYNMMEVNGSSYNMPYLEYGSRELVSSARTIYREINAEISKECWLLIKEAYDSTLAFEFYELIPILLQNAGFEKDILN